MRKRNLKWIDLGALTALVYVGSYIYASANGRFEPGIIGLNGVKCYEWAPKGFVHEFRWNRKLWCFHAPLCVLDMHLWHTSPKDGPYPINEVAPKDIGKVYRAWSR